MDCYTIWAFEILLLSLVIYAAFPADPLRKLFDIATAPIRKLFRTGGFSATIEMKVHRGDESWKYLELFIYVGFPAVVFSIPLAAAKPYGIILSLLNFGAAIYLCFFNAWFKNKIIILMREIKNRPDQVSA